MGGRFPGNGQLDTLTKQTITLNKSEIDISIEEQTGILWAIHFDRWYIVDC